MSDKITILETMTPKILATKQFTREEDGSISTVPYGRAKNFRWYQEDVSGLDDLEALLRRLAPAYQCIIIRGEPLPEVQPGDVVSRRQRPSKTGEEPHWRAADPGRRWVAFDFDGFRTPAYLEHAASDEVLAEVADAARQTLPSPFRAAGCVYRFSASAGVHGWREVSLHLWFWLDRPVCDYSIRDWAKGKIDASLYKAVQPHYTADPIFVGLDDPLRGRRIGRLEGTPAVSTPGDWLDLPTHLEAIEARVKPAPIPVVLPEGASVHDIEDARRKYVVKALESGCASIQAAGKGSRHDTAWHEAFAIGGYVGAGYLDRHVAESALIDAINSVVEPGRHAKEANSVRDAIELGALKPRSLDHVGTRHLAVVPDPPVSEAGSRGSSEEPAAGSREAMGLSETEDQKMAPYCGGLYKDREAIVSEVARGAPVDGHVVPRGYWLHGQGVGLWKETPHGMKYPTIEHAPIVVTATDEDIETGLQRVRIAWRDRGRKVWSSRWMPRQDALSKRGLERHIGHGFPVTSESSGGVVGWLRSYLAKNAEKIPHLRTASSMGWQGKGGELGFLAGRRHIVDGGTFAVVDLEDPKTWRPDRIAFCAAESDAGGDQIADAVVDSGSYGRWKDAIDRLQRFPLALVGVLGSLSAPLVEVVGCPNFILDWAFRTSTGKTTILQAAASVWGNPDEQSGGFIRSWMATATNIERTAVTLRSLPLLMDDTAQAKHPDIVSGAIYDLCKGTSKPRGTKTGTEAVRHFRLPILSTGEQPATSFAEKGGAKARCLEITELPFGAESRETGVFVRELKLDLLANYGHAGPRLVAWMLQRRPEWAEWREQFRTRVRELSVSSASGAESRTCETRALLELTLRLAQEAGIMDVADPIPFAWLGIAAEVEDAAGEDRALHRAIGWYASNRARFIGSASADPAYPPSQGWLGVVVTPRGSKPAFVGFTEAPLSEFLERQGFSARAIIKGWASRGWLITDTDRKRLTKSAKMEGAKVRVIALPLTLFEGDPEERPPPETSISPHTWGPKQQEWDL